MYGKTITPTTSPQKHLHPHPPPKLETFEGQIVSGIREELRRKHETARIQVEVGILRDAAARQRRREHDLEHFVRDTAFPVTDDVGVRLGLVRKAAEKLSSTTADEVRDELRDLLDSLEEAIEDQVLLLCHHHEQMQRSGGRREKNEVEQRSQSSTTVLGDRLYPETNGPIDSAPADCGLRRQKHRSSLPVCASPGIPIAPTSATEATLAAAPFLTAESLAIVLRCERVSVYLDAGGPTVECVATFPLIADENYAEGADIGAPPPPATVGESEATSASVVAAAHFSIPGRQVRGQDAIAALQATRERVADVALRGALSGTGSRQQNLRCATAVAHAGVAFRLTGTDVGGDAAGVPPTQPVVSASASAGAAAPPTTVLPGSLPHSPAGLKFAASLRMPQLPRVLASAVAQRGLAVSGFSSGAEAKLHIAAASTLRPARRGPKAAAAAALAAAVLAGPKCVLAWPIWTWRSGQRVVAGVIECTNKEASNTTSTATSATAFAGTAAEEMHRFTERDEALVAAAARSLAALLERHGFHRAFTTGIPAAAAGLGVLGGAEAPHLPRPFRVDIKGAEATTAAALRAPLSTTVARSPMAQLHKVAAAARQRADLTTTVGGVVSFVSTSAEGAAGDLRSVEEAVDSLTAMWRTAHEEGRLMHAQCRNYAAQLTEARHAAEEARMALTAAQSVAPMECRALLRKGELALVRCGDGGSTGVLKRSSVLSGLEGGVVASRNSENVNPIPTAGNPVGCSTPMGVPEQSKAEDRRRVRADAEAAVEGPPGVRRYTVDVAAVRSRQITVGKLLNDAAEVRELDDQTTAAAVPRFLRDTATAVARRGTIKAAVPPPDAVTARFDEASGERTGVVQNPAAKGCAHPTTKRFAAGGNARDVLLEVPPELPPVYSHISTTRAYHGTVLPEFSVYSPRAKSARIPTRRAAGKRPPPLPGRHFSDGVSLFRVAPPPEM